MSEYSKVDDDELDLEEGECSDDDEGMAVVTSTEIRPAKTEMTLPKVEVRSAGYRQCGIPQIVINSDQSDNNSDGDDNDDDEDLNSYGKRACWNNTRSSTTHYNAHTSSDTTFINPLRNPEMVQSFRKRRNNIWGSVMTEQILSQDIKQFGVKAPLPSQCDRNVESYDFTVAKLDDRPDIEPEKVERKPDADDIFGGDVVDLEGDVEEQQTRKRRREIKKRLGPRVHHRHQHQPKHETTTGGDGSRRLSALIVTAQDDANTVAQAIIDGLYEQNVPLFTRIVENIGIDMSIQLYSKTADVESAGGMMINNGFRRRTSGGVFIQLMKSEPSIPETVISQIFGPENEKWKDRQKQIRKIKKAARKNWTKKQTNKKVDIDRPDTPTPTRELEELEEEENNGMQDEEEGEEDAVDLPDRPDTPEPKDSSDNQTDDGEEEEEEEEDIAVAIAKAKAAILKKQREMAETKIEDNDNNSLPSPNQEEESIEMG